MTKIYGNTQNPSTFLGNIASKTLNPSTDSDLKARNKPKPRTRLRKNGAPVGRRSRPETPLLKWKTSEVVGRRNGDPIEEEVDGGSVAECGRNPCRKGKKGKKAGLSARKLAAGLWRLQPPEEGKRGFQRSEDRLWLQHGIGHAGLPLRLHHNGKAYGTSPKDQSQSPHSIYGRKNGFFCKLDPSFQFPNVEMEGATKWDPVCLKKPEEAHQIYGHVKLLDQQVSAVSMVSAIETELEQAQARIQELESERHTSKKKLEHFLRKVSEERASWRSREHEKIRVYVDDIKVELNRERKNCQRLEIVNSRLVNELADAKLSAKRHMLDYEKERKSREMVEEICDELAKEIGEDKVEVEALKRESMKLREEVEEERKMLQMAEVWREERVQMKLVDAKVALEQKYSQMNTLVADLEAFLKLKFAISDVKEIREAELLRQAAASVDIQDIKGFKYEPPNTYDIFSVFEDINNAEAREGEIEPSDASKVHTVSPDSNLLRKDNIQRHSNAYFDENGDIEDDSGWETVSHFEDQASSNSPEGSATSVNKNMRESNVSGSALEWEGEEIPITEISEVCSIPTKQRKKSSSISRLWRSCPSNGENYKIISVEGINGKLSNGRLSNGSFLSPDRGSGKGGLSPPNMMGQWSSPESGNNRGCIPRSAQKNSLKSKLLEARIESHKVQLRHVLKQKI